MVAWIAYYSLCAEQAGNIFFIPLVLHPYSTSEQQNCGALTIYKYSVLASQFNSAPDIPSQALSHLPPPSKKPHFITMLTITKVVPLPPKPPFPTPNLTNSPPAPPPPRHHPHHPNPPNLCLLLQLPRSLHLQRLQLQPNLLVTGLPLPRILQQRVLGLRRLVPNVQHRRVIFL